MATWIVEEPKWHWTLQRHLSHLQDQGILCDTKLACANGKTIKAHSCVLAAASDRIRNLLDGVQSNDYTLRMDSVTSTTWHYILRFIYDGRVALPLDQVERVKDAAIRFQIEPLISLLSTLEKIRGKVVAVDDSNVSGKTSASCEDKDDVIVLDDEDEDDDDGVLVVEKESSNVASNVTVPAKDGVAIISGAGGDCVQLGLSSSSQSSRLLESIDDRTSSTLVGRLAEASLADDSCANVSVEKPLVCSAETHECVDSDNVLPDTCGQSTDIDSVGLHVLSSESLGSSSFSSVIQNTSQCTVLSETRDSSNDANDAFDVSEVICMDSPASGCTEAEAKAAKKSCDRSDGVSKKKSIVIRRKSAPSKMLSFVQPGSFAGRPFSGIYSQFMVSRPSEMTLPVVVNTKERTDMLETVAGDVLSVHEPGSSEDQTGPVSSPSEVRADDEPPLLCISNIVSLSGQMTDFFEPDSAFNSNPCSSPLKVGAEVATDDLRTQESYVEDDSSTSMPCLSVSPPAILENPISNSTEFVTTQMMHGSNFAVVPQTLSRSALHINLSSSTILTEDGSELSNGCASMHQNSMNNLSGSRAAYRVLLARSPEPNNGSGISNVRLVSLPHDSQSSTISQSMVSSRFGGYEQFSVPSTVPVPAVPCSGFVEDFPVPSVVSFPSVPLSGHVEEFPVPSVVRFSSMPHLRRQEEFSVPPVVPFGAISRVPRPILELYDSDKAKETYPKPAGSVIPSGKVRAKKTTTSQFVPAVKNPNKLFAENTTTKRPRLLKNGVGLKPGPKRRKAMTPVETGMTPTEPSDGVTEYAWPGESGQFSGCTEEVTTDHDYQRKSLTRESSMVAEPVLKTRKSTKPLSAVGSSGKADFSPVTSSRSFADETGFVQPDSTVRETRPLPLKESVYNFTESDSESNVLPGMPQPSITSTQPTGTVNGSAIIPKRRGRPPNSAGQPAKPTLAKHPTETETVKQQLLHTEDKPKKTRKRRSKLTVDESGGSASIVNPPPTVSFVGREIRHEWVVEMESRATRWYTGKVLSVVSGKDGEKNSQYEVKYEGEEISYLIDHLFEDYLDGSLTFV